MKDFTIKIPKTIIDNPNAIIGYALLQPYISISFFNYLDIKVNTLKVNAKISPSLKWIETRLDNVISAKYIVGKKNNSVYTFCADTYYNDKDYFAIIYYSDLIKIIQSDFKSKDLLVQFFCYIMINRNYTTKKCKIAIEKICNDLSLSRSTVFRYNNALADLKLLHIKSTYSGGMRDFNEYMYYGDYKEEEDLFA